MIVDCSVIERSILFDGPNFILLLITESNRTIGVRLDTPVRDYR